MKTNAIVRIILYSIAILVLLGILLGGVAFGMYMFGEDAVIHTSGNSQELPIVSDNLNAQTIITADAVRNLEIDWVAGSISIEPKDGISTITVAESGSDNEKYRMICRQSGNTLKIQFCEESISFSSFGISVDISKDLVITVPANWTCDTIDIDAASASVEICNMNIGEVDFDGASGTCKFNSCTVGNLNMSTVSGDVDFLGTLNTLDCEAVSANFHGVFDQTPFELDFEGVSGDMDITLPENCGFTASLDSLSGNFHSDFPTTTHNGNHVYGDGRCHIQAEGVSGSITIRNGRFPSLETSVHVEEIHCTEPDCIDESHIHSVLCTDSDCTDASHDHSTVCTTSDCTDESHGHSGKHSGKHHG